MQACIQSGNGIEMENPPDVPFFDRRYLAQTFLDAYKDVEIIVPTEDVLRDSTVNVDHLRVNKTPGRTKLVRQFILGMVYFVGRGMEVALAQMKEFSCQRMNEWGQKWDTLHINLDRTKTHVHAQSLSLFPHRDDFLQCFYFAFGYQLVMQEVPDPNVCPEFAKKVDKKVKGSEESEDEAVTGIKSQVSTFFKDV